MAAWIHFYAKEEEGGEFRCEMAEELLANYLPGSFVIIREEDTTTYIVERLAIGTTHRRVESHDTLKSLMAGSSSLRYPLRLPHKTPFG